MKTVVQMGAETAEPAQGQVQVGAATAATTATAWLPRGHIGFDDWLVHGRRLGVIGRACSWWIGDWLRYGNARYGEKYSRATQVTGYDAKSLRNMVYVAARFSAARRRESLSFSHHAAVASLSHDDQERWLDVSERERLSVRCLRLEVSHERRDAAAPDVPAPQPVLATPPPAAAPPAPAQPAPVSAPVQPAPVSAPARPSVLSAAADRTDSVCCPECGCHFQPAPSRRCSWPQAQAA